MNSIIFASGWSELFVNTKNHYLPTTTHLYIIIVEKRSKCNGEYNYFIYLLMYTYLHTYLLTYLDTNAKIGLSTSKLNTGLILAFKQDLKQTTILIKPSYIRPFHLQLYLLFFLLANRLFLLILPDTK